LILKDGDGDGKDLPPAEKFGGWGGGGEASRYSGVSFPETNSSEKLTESPSRKILVK